MEGTGESGSSAFDEEEFDTAAAAEFLNCSPGYLCNPLWGDGPHFQRKFKRRGILYLGADLKAYKMRDRYPSSTEY